jgi:phage gp36-like protein
VSSYATTADFDQFGIRAAALPADVTSDDKQAACDSASGKADGYLGARFRLPLLNWGTDLTQYVCQIAAYDLVSGRVGYNPEAGQNTTLRDRMDDAKHWLQDVAAGKVTPVVTDSTPAASSVSRVYSNTRRGW